MASPKIKFWQLPSGYNPATDNDVQQVTSDELLPVKPKSDQLTDTVELTGVLPLRAALCYPYNPSAPRSQVPLIPPSGGRTYWVPDGVPMDTILIGPVGSLGIVILDGNSNPVPPGPSGYVIHESTGAAVGFDFNVGPAAGSAAISFRVRASTPTTTWALPYDEPYTGTNATVARLMVSPDGGAWQAASADGTSGEYVTLGTPASTLTATYYAQANPTQYFAFPDDNVVVDHFLMHPDVFVGWYDYPGDKSNTSDGGPVPQFQAKDSYTLNGRDGIVVFRNAVDVTLATIDGHQNEVRANYAAYAGVGNVDDQAMIPDAADPSGRRYKVSDTDPLYPASVGRPWVRRNDASVPTIVRVNGVQTPNNVQVTPDEVLGYFT